LNSQFPAVLASWYRVDREKCKGFKQLLDTYDVDGPLRGDASYGLLVQRIKAVRELNSWVTETWDSQSEAVFKKYMPLTVKSGVDFVWLPPSTLELIRYMGFMLLSAAIALRITKVTVEIRRWYRPAAS
jgi:hypothetical protein